MRQIYPEPCTQCGECCKAEACIIAEAVLDRITTPCSALECSEGKYWCGLITNTSKYLDLGKGKWRYGFVGRHLKEIFKFGAGCDSAKE